MTSHFIRATKPLASAALALSALSAHAWDCPASKWLASHDTAPAYRHEVLVAPLTHHWHPSPEHRYAGLLGYAQYGADNTLCGGAVFTNSFGQPSITAYIGKRWDGPFGLPQQVFTHIVAGPMYGYVGPYQHKVPFNYKGFSPLIVPTIGYQIAPQHAVQLMVLGNSALMLGYSHRF